MNFNFRNKMLAFIAVATIGLGGVGTMAYTAYAQEAPPAQSQPEGNEDGIQQEEDGNRRHGKCNKDRDRGEDDTDTTESNDNASVLGGLFNL
ncbi:MAG: hypothetical protein AAF702_23695 [Chloroflexota bacterium]